MRDDDYNNDDDDDKTRGPAMNRIRIRRMCKPQLVQRTESLCTFTTNCNVKKNRKQY